MITEAIEQVINNENLSSDLSYGIMLEIMAGEIPDSQIASLLTALKIKGESENEIAGFAKAMRYNGISISPSGNNIVDVCGTGGDSSGTFNISTAASFVVAGAGVKVAKHGNRSISSKCGSSDVLGELGVNINLKPIQSEEALNEIGIAFLYAPIFHPAMKNVAPVRKELGFKTIFNILGPLTNPAGTKKQLIGTYNLQTARLMANAARLLEMEKVCFVCTGNKYDEITLSDVTKVIEYEPATGITEYEISNNTFNLPRAELTELKGSTAGENAEIITSVLKDNKVGAAYNVVTANGAMGLYASGYSNSIYECKLAAEESLQSGSAYAKLNELITFGKRF